jgi:hypothetical protein
MPRALTSSTLGLTAALLTLLSGCEARKSGTETASAGAATTTDTAAGTWEEVKGAIAITTGSEEARKLYPRRPTCSRWRRTRSCGRRRGRWRSGRPRVILSASEGSA